MKSSMTLLLTLNFTLAANVFAAEPSATPSPQPTSSVRIANSSLLEIQSITQLVKDYEAAYNRGDANAVAALYTEDAEYIGESGNVVSGRDIIEKLLAGKLASNPGAKLEIDMKSVRLLSPDVVVEKGIATIAAPAGPPGTSTYLVVYLKSAGNWKISQLSETTGSASSIGASSRLQDLAWMVGYWQNETDHSKVEMSVEWTQGQNFLTRRFNFFRADGQQTEGWEVIGWDSVTQEIRSWAFDTDGGFGDRFWTKQGNGWLIEAVNTLPDGTETTAQLVITKLDDDHYIWQSGIRSADGILPPPITVARIGKQ
jgi:uncharacterized protein (TIGR02246 family)